MTENGIADQNNKNIYEPRPQDILEENVDNRIKDDAMMTIIKLFIFPVCYDR